MKDFQPCNEACAAGASCPPCNQACYQGRNCPARKEDAEELAEIDTGLLAACGLIFGVFVVSGLVVTLIRIYP